MNRKAIDKLIDSIIDDICARRDLNPATSNKGGERETAQAFLSMALKGHREALLTASGAPAPAEEAAAA